jgi:glycosyltransferase involved in cell wall biosynthesis
MKLNKNPRVALVHDYLNQYGGAEKTLEKIMELFPEAPIYTGILDLTKLPNKFETRNIKTPAMNFVLKRFPKLFTFLMASRFEDFDLSNYDLVISDGTAWAKSVITNSDQLHISYVHTPPRFLYKYSTESTLRKNILLMPLFAYLDFYLRIWDFSAAKRPDFLIANSKEVQKRIKKFYKRESIVIYPPVETSRFDKANDVRDYYVISGRLSSYKNFDLIVELFNNIEKNLIVIGTGIEEKNLKNLAKKNIKFLGKVSNEELHETLSHAKGYLFPVKEEDFGIAPIEALSHGIPVLAHRSGGPLETIIENKDGLFFDEINLESLTSKFVEFDKKINENFFDRKEISERAQKFNEKYFIKNLSEFIEDKWNRFSEKNN